MDYPVFPHEENKLKKAVKELKNCQSQCLKLANENEALIEKNKELYIKLNELKGNE